MAIEVKGRLGTYRFSILPAHKSCAECGGLTRWEVSIREVGPVCVPVCRRCWELIGLRPTDVVQAVLMANTDEVAAKLKGEEDHGKASGIPDDELHRILSEVA